jgi:hypothetical protein
LERLGGTAIDLRRQARLPDVLSSPVSAGLFLAHGGAVSSSVDSALGRHQGSLPRKAQTAAGPLGRRRHHRRRGGAFGAEFWVGLLAPRALRRLPHALDRGVAVRAGELRLTPRSPSGRHLVPPKEKAALWRSKLHRRRSRAGAKLAVGGATSKAMTTLADMNHLWPADHNATPSVATRDGSWTRMVR